MKKLFKEFKEFISRGNVMDLAVGMIIGAAFTAIITAVVSGILTPLINMIPGTDGGALQVVLRDPVIKDIEGVPTVVKEAVVLDFGAVISAIVTFLLTALLLFIIVKAFNGMKKRAEEAKAKAEEALKKEEAPAEEAVVEEAPAVEEEPKETTDDILKKILAELQKSNEDK